MSGPVIRFALVVTSLLGKLAISSWPPPSSSPLVVPNRFPSWRFAVATKPLSTDRRTRFACTLGEKRCYRNVARDGEPDSYSDKLYRRFVIFADVTIARSKMQQPSRGTCNDFFLHCAVEGIALREFLPHFISNCSCNIVLLQTTDNLESFIV